MLPSSPGPPLHEGNNSRVGKCGRREEEKTQSSAGARSMRPLCMQPLVKDDSWPTIVSGLLTRAKWTST